MNNFAENFSDNDFDRLMALNKNQLQQRQKEVDMKEFIMNPNSKDSLFTNAPPATFNPPNHESERDRRLRLRAQERANRLAGIQTSAYQNHPTEEHPAQQIDSYPPDFFNKKQDLPSYHADDLFRNQPEEPFTSKKEELFANREPDSFPNRREDLFAPDQQTPEDVAPISQSFLYGNQPSEADKKKKYFEELQAQQRENTKFNHQAQEDLHDHFLPPSRETSSHDKKKQYFEELQAQEREKQRRKQQTFEQQEDFFMPSNPSSNIDKKRQYFEELQAQEREKQRRKQQVQEQPEDFFMPSNPSSNFDKKKQYFEELQAQEREKQRLKQQALEQQEDFFMPSNPSSNIDKKKQYFEELQAQEREKQRLKQQAMEQPEDFFKPSNPSSNFDRKRQYFEELKAQEREKQRLKEIERAQDEGFPYSSKNHDPQAVDKKKLYYQQLQNQQRQKASLAQNDREELQSQPSRQTQPESFESYPFPSQPAPDNQKKMQYNRELKMQMEEQKQRKEKEKEELKRQQELDELRYLKQIGQEPQKVHVKKTDPNKPSEENPHMERYQEFLNQPPKTHYSNEPAKNYHSNDPVGLPPIGKASKKHLFDPEPSVGQDLPPMGRLPPSNEELPNQFGYHQTPNQSNHNWNNPSNFPNQIPNPYNHPSNLPGNFNPPSGYPNQQFKNVPLPVQTHPDPESFDLKGNVNEYLTELEKIRNEREKAREDMLEMREMMLREREKQLEGMVNMMKFQQNLMVQRNAFNPSQMPPSPKYPPHNYYAPANNPPHFNPPQHFADQMPQDFPNAQFPSNPRLNQQFPSNPAMSPFNQQISANPSASSFNQEYPPKAPISHAKDHLASNSRLQDFSSDSTVLPPPSYQSNSPIPISPIPTPSEPSQKLSEISKRLKQPVQPPADLLDVDLEQSLANTSKFVSPNMAWGNLRIDESAQLAKPEPFPQRKMWAHDQTPRFVMDSHCKEKDLPYEENIQEEIYESEDEIPEEIIIEEEEKQDKASKEIVMEEPRYEESQSYQIADSPQELEFEIPSNKGSFYSKPKIINVFKQKPKPSDSFEKPPVSKLGEARRQAKELKSRDKFDDIDMVLSGLQGKPSEPQFAGKFTRIALTELRSQKQKSANQSTDSITNKKILSALDEILDQEKRD